MLIKNEGWTLADMPDLRGKAAIVTGANTGIGYEIARSLYVAGADVTIAARDETKTMAAIAHMSSGQGRGSIKYAALDLADLDSVKRFSEAFCDHHPALDILVNNAGVMYPPATRTREGFELQFGVNFLGHFALSARLSAILFKTPGSRIVTMSSGAYKRVENIDFSNHKMEKGYDAAQAYATSKLADLVFALELDRQIRTMGHQTASIAAHPGVSRTSLQRHIDPKELDKRMLAFGETMPPTQAALPALYAATSPEATGGAYYGPDGEHEYSGCPAPALITETAKSTQLAAQLWELAEEATSVSFYNKY
ncbi:oxidoreductase [Pedobacter zeae]|uniref:NAD(P)-dependent dehydrogenase (Short-subunit alcohol dehydrogenase family) n=1 Tax=Pedobacter zeae TaxID=1737356 RepID=A0A7W6KDV9_9SPHI|nr:oxidoreductase [Pedobacter zeae]MBB4109081.1 NAD(P)-dependent dehydrogenase (short-subunit alcohol dehydrogenase family) [Pedobacter zeae]GGH10163.1 putative short-chain dehydrogenase/reductase [Pedobacter zeae]